MTDISKSKPALIGIPLDEHSSYLKGAALAPPKIREALHSSSSNLWSEKGVNLGEEALFIDAGDVTFTAEGNAFDTIEQSITQLLDNNCVPVSLGGDHAITLPVVKAVHTSCPGFHILHFDAHPDLYDELDGDRYSHACPFARIMEQGLARGITQIGIRTMNGHQKKQAETFNVTVIDMASWNDDLPLEFSAPLYLSIDMDVLDPAFAPGVSHFEPGGLSTRQLLTCIQKIKAPKLVGADIVEFNPSRDSSGMTAMVCAKVLKEVVAKILGLS